MSKKKKPDDKPSPETMERCVAIIRRIVEIANTDGAITFEQDFGGNSLTVMVPKGHTHLGDEDAPFELLVENLYDTLHGGPGLSWAGEAPQVIKDAQPEAP